jgi:acyl-CoA thioesterase FadM
VGFWRTLYVLLSFRGRGRIGLFDTSRLTLRVMPGEIDFNFHMNNGRYFSAADIGRLDWGLRSNLWRNAFSHGWRAVAGDSNARFSRSLQPFDRYTLESRLLGWDEKWLFCEHRFVRGADVYATVLVRYLFLSKRGKVPPAVVLEKAGHPTQSPPLPPWVLNWHEAQEGLTAALRAERAASHPH